MVLQVHYMVMFEKILRLIVRGLMWMQTLTLSNHFVVNPQQY